MGRLPYQRGDRAVSDGDLCLVHCWDVFIVCISGRTSLFLDLLPKARAERAFEALALQGWESQVAVSD